MWILTVRGMNSHSGGSRSGRFSWDTLLISVHWNLFRLNFLLRTNNKSKRQKLSTWNPDVVAPILAIWFLILAYLILSQKLLILVSSLMCVKIFRNLNFTHNQHCRFVCFFCNLCWRLNWVPWIVPENVRANNVISEFWSYFSLGLVSAWNDASIAMPTQVPRLSPWHPNHFPLLVESIPQSRSDQQYASSSSLSHPSRLLFKILNLVWNCTRREKK